MHPPKSGNQNPSIQKWKGERETGGHGDDAEFQSTEWVIITFTSLILKPVPELSSWRHLLWEKNNCRVYDQSNPDIQFNALIISLKKYVPFSIYIENGIHFGSMSVVPDKFLVQWLKTNIIRKTKNILEAIA